MDINININGKLTIDKDDLERFKSTGADELLRALILSNTDIKVRVSEIYQKEA